MQLTPNQIAIINRYTEKSFDALFEDIGDQLTESDILDHEVDSDNDEEWVELRDAVERTIHAKILEMYQSKEQDIT